MLAAGRASRMGRPKHLLPVDGVPMLERVLAALSAARVSGVVVVLRGGDPEGRRIARRRGVHAVEAEDPDEGRAASIRAGVRAVPAPVDGFLFALADQPFLLAEDFDSLISRFEAGGAAIVHATYDGTRGSPVLFDAGYRAELLGLRGSEGGREVVRRHPAESAGVPLPTERGRDVDSPDDLHPV